MEKCDVIQDLIPLYYDEVASEGSRILVDEHIKTCTDCQKMLENMNDRSKMTVNYKNIEINALKAIKRKIIKKIAIVSFTAVACTVFILWVVLFWQISMPHNARNIEVSPIQLFHDYELTEPFYGVVAIDVRNNYLDAHFMQIDDVLYFHLTSTVATRIFGGRFTSRLMSISTGVSPLIIPINLENGTHRYEVTVSGFTTAHRAGNHANTDEPFNIRIEMAYELANITNINRIYYLRGRFNRLWSNEAAFESAMENAVLLWER